MLAGKRDGQRTRVSERCRSDESSAIMIEWQLVQMEVIDSCRGSEEPRPVRGRIGEMPPTRDIPKLHLVRGLLRKPLPPLPHFGYNPHCL